MGGKRPTRRDFLIAGSSVAIAAAVPAGGAPTDPGEQASHDQASLNTAKGGEAGNAVPFSREELLRMGPQRTFTGDRTTQIALPIGGLGAGSVCMNGYGGLQDFSIRTRPETTALPEGFTANSAEAAFAVLHVKGERAGTKLVEGPFPPFKIFDQGLQGQGLRRGGFEGFPRFAKCTFQGEYPFGVARLSDATVPLEVTVTGWNPFIPLDDKNSGIPCAILEYELHNTSARAVEYEFSYHLSHLAPGCKPDSASSRNAVIAGKGAFLSNGEEAHAEGFGSAALIAVGETPRVKAMWLRSPGWEVDALSAVWREVSSGKFTENNGTNAVDHAGRNGASILLPGRLGAGAKRTHRVVIAWHFPNCYLRQGGKAEDAGIKGADGCRVEDGDRPAPWRPFYAGVWQDARDVALYVEQNYASLRKRTVAFKEALFSSTLPPYVLDAVSANLGILKSPTVLREENGNVWGWEGCFPDSGCCHGSCTHVWNYAQAMPHLYPRLERTLRDLELARSMDERGHVTFRGAIPDGPVDHTFYAAADGQPGGVMKVYRDWQISGDAEWMRRMYPLVKRSIEYGIRTWDPERKGALFEPHHNTYDIEFWGAEPMCSTIYLGALCAMAKMAAAVGEEADAKSYEELGNRAAAFLDGQLFNGEYYEQKVQYEGLKDTSFARSIAGVNEQSSEMQQLLKREGPKYQYGPGCLSDGVIGAWMAKIYGIDTPLKREHVRSALGAIFKHNFKTDLSEHANAQRPGYALGHEPGLLVCSWPRGGKPTLPFVYSDEAWTGIEYQVASHLIEEGLVEEGLTIVQAARSRYEGRTRNPWNEYECGNWYARAMASYAVLGALSGFRYSAVDKTLHFGPKLAVRPFKTFFSTASGFGVIALDEHTLAIEVIEGELAVRKLVLTHGGEKKAMECNVRVRPGETAVKAI
jgi:uncharacterized protein (DUF608 family)